MTENMQVKLMKHVQTMLMVKDQRNVEADKKSEHFQKFKDHLGNEQELTRQLNSEIENFEVFRIGGIKNEQRKKDNRKKLQKK